MSETKETQFCVMKRRVGRDNGFFLTTGIVWFDARQDARDYAKKRNEKTSRVHYKAFPMKRGPRA